MLVCTSYHMYGFQVTYNNKFMTLFFVGQKRAAEISGSIQRILTEVEIMTSKATSHSDAIICHKEKIEKHEEEWRRINRGVAERVERMRALQEELAASIAGEYSTFYI